MKRSAVQFSSRLLSGSTVEDSTILLGLRVVVVGAQRPESDSLCGRCSLTAARVILRRLVRSQGHFS